VTQINLPVANESVKSESCSLRVNGEPPNKSALRCVPSRKRKSGPSLLPTLGCLQRTDDGPESGDHCFLVRYVCHFLTVSACFFYHHAHCLRTIVDP
jgi:hypothetical protein